MTRPIEHIATVVRAGDGVVEVELTAQSACASCHARMACGMGESTRKRIEIATPEASAFTAGERVTVSVERNMGMTAVLWAYVWLLDTTAAADERSSDRVGGAADNEETHKSQ